MLQLAAKLEQARVSANLSVTEAAKKVGKKRSTYQYWEEKGPPIDEIPVITKAFGLPDNYFFVNDPEQFANNPVPLGDLRVTLKDHFELMQAKDALYREYTSVMKRIIEAKLLEPNNSSSKEEQTAKTDEQLDEEAFDSGTSPIVDAAGGNYRVKKRKRAKKVK